MLAWMGGKQRLVALAKHKIQQTQQRGGGGGGSAAAVAAAGGGSGMAPMPATTTQQQRGTKRSTGDGTSHGEDAAAGGERPQACAAGPGGGDGQHPQPALKRTKRSLDLLALQFPATWGPAACGEHHAQQAQALAVQEGSGGTGE